MCLPILTTSSAICAVSSGTLALSVAVTGSVAGTTPTGTVQFFVDNAAVSGGSVTLAGGTASYTLNTSGLSSGGHSISAVYSGDGNYAGSKGTLLGPAVNTGTYPNGPLASVDIVSGKDFSLTPCTGTATNVTVQPGATSAGLTLTVTPTGGFTGTVNLTATNNDGMTGTPVFTPTSLNVSTGAVTTTLTVQAFQTTTAQLAKPSPQRRSGKTPWYAAGSGATLACMLLFLRPRRRRWGALLAAVLSIAILTVAGCGGNTSNSGGGGGGGGGGGSTTTPAAAGT